MQTDARSPELEQVLDEMRGYGSLSPLSAGAARVKVWESRLRALVGQAREETPIQPVHRHHVLWNPATLCAECACGFKSSEIEAVNTDYGRLPAAASHARPETPAAVSPNGQFRKKAVAIEAMQWNGDDEALINWAQSFGRPYPMLNFIAPFPGGDVEIETLEGVMLARDGDWIIHGIKGEFYPVKPDIFAATHEPVSAPAIQERTAEAAPPGWEWAHERDSRLIKQDGWMCEKHPGVAWPHDDCAGPGMPWLLEGKAAIEALRAASPSGSALLEKLERYEPQYDSDDPMTFNGMGTDPCGAWVSFAAVRALLADGGKEGQ